jgi:hypothetical protein
MTRLVKIKHPEHLKEDSRPDFNVESILHLYRKSKIPDSVAGWMIVVAAKRPLRAVYGSNLRAGLAIVRDDLIDRFTALRYRLRLLTPKEREWEREFGDKNALLP